MSESLRLRHSPGRKCEMSDTGLYLRAQHAVAELKGAILDLLASHPNGMTNADVGRTLGIYQGHSSGQEGHISRTLLALLQEEGVALQDKETKLWRLRTK
jgi:hypothetical protein